MANRRNYMYMTNNTSYKKLSKIYPYSTTLFANVFFHIMDHDYDSETLDDLLDKYDKEVHETVYEDSDIDEMFDDEEKAFNIDKFMDDIEDCEDEETTENEYLDSLYEEYSEDIQEYFTEVLQCDMIFGYKFAANGEFENISEILKETDRSKFKVVMVGIRFTNTIDEKVYDKFRSAIISDEQFLDSYNDIRKQNVDIINNTLGETESIMGTLQNIVLQIIVKYVMTNAQYYIPTNHEVVNLPLDDEQSVYIETNIEGFFFNISKFKLSFDLNSYSINDYMLNKVLDNVYGNIIRFGNAVNLLLENSKKIELFKYDNDTKSCILIKNDSGCTYLFLDGWKSENKPKTKKRKK